VHIKDMKKLAAFLVALAFPLTAAANDDPWVYVKGPHEASMSGSMNDLKAARAQQKRPDEQLVYVKRGKKAFVIRDAGVLAKLDVQNTQLDAVQAKMQVVQAKIEPITQRMGAIGETMGELGQIMGELGERLGSLKHDDSRREKVEAEMRRLESVMQELQKPMTALQRQLAPHQEVIEKLSSEIQRLADQSEQRSMAIIDEAIATGKATPVK
jgi:chromosome segregation ATPase